MKKIVSIVLALVLVLAIAAPAMAITGYVTPTEETKSASAPYAIKLTLIDSAAAGLGVLSVNAAASNKAYVANEVIYGKVEIASNTKTTWDKNDYIEPVLKVSSDAVLFQGVKVYEITDATADVLLQKAGTNGSVKDVTGDLTTDVTSTKITVNSFTLNKNYTVLFSGIVRAQGAITATLMGGHKIYFDGVDANMKKDASYFIYNDLGELQYRLVKDADTNVTVYDGKSNYVSFYRTEDVCTKIAVNGYEVKYTTPISNEGVSVQAFGTQATSQDADLTEFNKLKAVYDNVMNFFGFDYNAKGLLLDAHFTCKLHSFNASDAVTVNLYTAAITVPDADVEIPQTGDAATTLGFVMIAMAIVAAAAVAYKKVRA